MPGSDESRAAVVADFLEFLHASGYHLVINLGGVGDEPCRVEAHERNALVCEWLGVDPVELERERRAVLDDLRVGRTESKDGADAQAPSLDQGYTEAQKRDVLSKIPQRVRDALKHSGLRVPPGYTIFLNEKDVSEYMARLSLTEDDKWLAIDMLGRWQRRTERLFRDHELLLEDSARESAKKARAAAVGPTQASLPAHAGAPLATGTVPPGEDPE